MVFFPTRKLRYRMPLLLNYARLKFITNHTKGDERYAMHGIMLNGIDKKNKMISNKISFKANAAFQKCDELVDSTLIGWQNKMHFMAAYLHKKYRVEGVSLDALTDQFDFNKDFGITKKDMMVDFGNDSVGYSKLIEAKQSVILDLLAIGMNIRQCYILFLFFFILYLLLKFNHLN